MKSRVALIIFLSIFAVVVFIIVILPFVFNRRPEDGAGNQTGSGTAAGDTGVFRSDDGGKTWQAKSWIEGRSGSISAIKVNRLIQDPADPAALYLATGGNGLWVSRSRGDLWAKVIDAGGTLEPGANVLSLAVNPDNPAGEWYLAVFQKKRGRLLRTADGGRTFREIYFMPVERFGIFDVYYDRATHAARIVTGQGGLLETADQGRTWRVVRWFSEGLVKLLVNPVDTSIQLVVTPAGSVFRTEDRGLNWADLTPVLRDFSAATVDQKWLFGANGRLYLGSGYGLLRSPDSGTTFSPLELIIPPEALPILAIAADPQNSANLVVSAGSQIYRSKDDGATWSILTTPTTKNITQLLFDPRNSETIYAVAN